MLLSRLPRIIRGSAAATFSTFVALFSHIAGGGSTPGLLGVAVPLFLAIVVSIFVSGRAFSWIRLVVSVAISQVMFHTLFVLGAPSALGSIPADATGGHGGHTSSSSSVLTESVVSTLPPVGAGHIHTPSGSMWVAHIIAGVITVIALRQGDSVTLRLAELATWIIRRVVALALPSITTPTGLRRLPQRRRVIVPARWGVYPATTAHRGPPPVIV